MKTLERYSRTTNEISKLKQLDERLLVTPIQEGRWSIREIVAHLYGWDDYNLDHMVRDIAHGTNLPAFPDHDLHNEQVIESFNGRTVHEIIDLFINKRKEFVDTISNIDCKTRFTIGEGKRAFSPESFVNIFVKHDAHHLEQIKNFLEKS